MTCKEKLKIEHPDMIDNEKWGGCKGCPHMVVYMPRPKYCPYGGNEFEMLSMEAKKILCTECWNRVMPSSTSTKSEPIEPKPRISNMLDLLWFAEKVTANGDRSVNICKTGDGSLSISVYPYKEEQTNE